MRIAAAHGVAAIRIAYVISHLHHLFIVPEPARGDKRDTSKRQLCTNMQHVGQRGWRVVLRGTLGDQMRQSRLRADQ
jgi:hypothetical protein